MKPFDLEQALAGAPVQTRSGLEVKQLHKFDIGKEYPLCGVLIDSLYAWRIDGTWRMEDLDLFMAPVKKTGWIARYSDGTTSQWVRESEKQIKEAHPSALSYHEISWEE